MSSKLFFSLNSIQPQYQYSGGTATQVTAKEVPGFVNISFSQLKLHPKGFQEPVWHPNANKLGYTLQGKCAVTMRTPSGVDTFTVEQGDIFFIQQGYIHSIENIGSEETIISFVFNHTNPEIMCLSKAIYSLSDNVFNATFNSTTGVLDKIKKAPNKELFKTLSTTSRPSNNTSNQYKYNVEMSAKTIQSKGGYLQLGTKAQLPVLNELGLLRFGMNKGGDVEPHWHSNAGELVYIVSGHSRITILDPSGHVEVLEVKGGEGAFAPASHFHNIENIGNDDVEVIAFFSHAEPDYIGIGEVLGAYSNEILAATFNVSPKDFESLHRPQGPLVIVPV